MFRESQQIGPYTLIRKLGRGGFGEVWLAERRAKFVTTKVAVKLPLDEQIDHETIKQEAMLWEQASGHPNIVPILDADEYDGQIVIVSEYAPDGSLDEWLKRNGKMPIEKAVETTVKILDGLQFLHSRNIIHRDLKPANILLQGETPRLADFGISRALRTTVASQSQNISGTFAYMSPEALDGKRSVQTDVWSVGVNLYQFLTGTLPFPQKEPSVLFPAIIMREFAPLPDSIPQNLKNVIAKALAKLPENRYASAGEMREDLRRVLRGEEVSGFVESDLLVKQQSFSVTEIPPTQKSFPISAQNFQGETETIVRPMPAFGQDESRKNFYGWMYAALGLVLASVIGLGVYFLPINQNQIDSNKSEITRLTKGQSNNNSANSESVTTVANSNSNVVEPTPIPTPDKAQLQQVINRYIAGVAKASSGGYEYKKARKIVYGDIDGDGNDDAVVQFTIEGAGGGNNYSFSLAVFRNVTGKFESVTDKVIGGKMLRDVDLQAVRNGKIYINTKEYSEDDPACCPSIKGKTSYVLSGSKLVEK